MNTPTLNTTEEHENSIKEILKRHNVNVLSVKGETTPYAKPDVGFGIVIKGEATVPLEEKIKVLLRHYAYNIQFQP